MPKARPNRSSKRNFDAGDKFGADQFTEWHWGIEPSRVVHCDDPDLPSGELIECGRLIRLHFAAPRGERHPRRERDTMLQLSRQLSQSAHVAFDPNHSKQRMYFILPSKAMAVLRKRFWVENDVPAMYLSDLARIAGGHHGRMNDYPNLRVKPVGILTGVLYYTRKKGDENPDDPRSFYLHKMGEETQQYPFLAVDAKGRLWVAGGAYTAPTPGITN